MTSQPMMNGQMVHCRACGHSLHSTAPACPHCGAPQRAWRVSEKKILPTFLLCWFLGWLGLHRFYVGKVGTAILFVLTLGGLGIWYLIDFVMIIIGRFTDADGNQLTQWT